MTMGISFTLMFDSSNIYNGYQFSRGTHVFGGFPFLGGNHPLKIFSQLGGNSMAKGTPYPRGSDAFGSHYPFVSLYIGESYGPSNLNTLSSLYHNPFSNKQFPFLVILELPDLFWLTNDPIISNPTWPLVLTKLPSNIPKFIGKLGEYLTTYHLWHVSNLMLDDSIQLHVFLCTLTNSTSKLFIELPTASHHNFIALSMAFFIHF